ncbi:putative NAD(P)(+) transhydrogenase, alpha subunit [Dictyocaulus viviparus]|uniref:proton-translocating NAD(P)(+) transhydrogenase n=1 Tax=Dictyocaulus viviparus TaxID=29172 RepID=A0A0D8XAP4_DICVI|nr:putative NAD(P)(+) transhydrogenase, alpha subunit [Dictyocaulus viviparus]
MIPSNCIRLSKKPLIRLLCSQVKNIPVSELTVSAVRETSAGEKRVALSPAAVKLLCGKGFNVQLCCGLKTTSQVEECAGVGACWSDDEYIRHGAKIVDCKTAFQADIVLKIRPPSLEEVPLFKEKATLISFIYPATNKAILVDLAKQKLTVIAMDCVPRISRAQVFDALSSMANIAGYRATIEAANQFGRFFAGQITAAGKVNPAKVLVIGCGVSGLSAIATARSLGAIVRGFDTRAVVREQIHSLGGEFLTIPVKEDGEGTGGYAKEMTKRYLDVLNVEISQAEMDLFAKQCKEVDVIISTALIPGKPAPRLITEMEESLFGTWISSTDSFKFPRTDPAQYDDATELDSIIP